MHFRLPDAGNATQVFKDTIYLTQVSECGETLRRRVGGILFSENGDCFGKNINFTSTVTWKNLFFCQLSVGHFVRRRRR